MAARYFEGAAHAAAYSKFRPNAPLSLISRIINYVKEKHKGPLHSALDVGCGSGQSTYALAPHFTKVFGVDISQAQVDEAIKKNTSENITFQVSGAEILPFESGSIQLVTAGQACHWFDLPKFYKEVDRILTPNGVLALYGYNFPRPIWKTDTDELFNLMNKIYIQDTKDLWGSERKFVDNLYLDKDFVIPFSEFIREENFIHENKASVMDLAGYVTSWSGFQNYKSLKGQEEAQRLLDELISDTMKVTEATTAPEETKLTLRYSFFLNMGRKASS